MVLPDHTSHIKIDDVHQIVDICNPTTLGFDFDQAFWRGHSDAAWSLLPSVYRRPLHPERPKYDECALIGYFQMRAPTRSQTKTPEPDDYFGWLFLAQHYGLPTRLLDWTENPLVAAYFAVEEENGRDGCIWALWPNKLNEHFGGSNLITIRDPMVIELAKAAFTGAPGEDVVLAIDGREIDLRMLVQIGRFTIHTWGTPIEILAGSETWLHKYIVPKEYKQKIRHQLSAMGISRSNLFPDLSNLAADLRGTPFGSL